MSVSHAPFCEISTIETSINFNPPKDLFYHITLKSIIDEVNHDVVKYEPEFGDLFAFTNIKPRSINDLNRTNRYCQMAYVCGSKDEYTDEIPILLSKYMEMDDNKNSDFRRNKAQKLYVVYLINMTTNVRIWKFLNSQLEGSNMNIIKKVLQPQPGSRVRITNNLFMISYLGHVYGLQLQTYVWSRTTFAEGV